MSVAKADTVNIGQAQNATGNPAANASKSEPSIDEILASIRQVISEQNQQADQAAEQAVAAVANKAPEAPQIESIIGSVAADHWANHQNQPSGAPVSATSVQAGEVPPEPQVLPTAHKNVDELEELISLIGASPPAPQPTRQAKWNDPKSKDVPKTTVSEAAKVESSPFVKVDAEKPVVISHKPEATIVPPKILQQQEGINTAVGKKPAVVLQKSAPDTGIQQKADNQPGAHPSISPRSDVPDIIKQAIVRPMARVAAQEVRAHSTGKPVVSHKSALDRLIAKKEGAGGNSNIAAPSKVETIVKPAIDTPASTKLASSINARPSGPQPDGSASAAVQKPFDKPNANAAETAKPETNTQNVTTGSPAISAKSVNAAVARSIHNLASAMFKERKDEIDGMVAGIVRPMVQDWLEDNLPSLVERIVREEIERVSRGTHQN